MYEQIQAFLTMVDEENPNHYSHRRVFLEMVEMRDRDGFRIYRLGQAFLNSLRGTEYYKKLSQSPYDCFYSNEKHKVEEAIDFLCRKGPWEK